MKRGSAVELRPCPRNGASRGEESVLADSGREGEIPAGVGWVRSLDFLSILERDTFVISHVRVLDFVEIKNRFPEACYTECHGPTQGKDCRFTVLPTRICYTFASRRITDSHHFHQDA